MRHSIFVVAACLPHFVMAMDKEAVIPPVLQKALKAANKEYKQQKWDELPLSKELKTFFAKYSSILSAASLQAQPYGNESDKQLYRVRLCMNNPGIQQEMRVVINDMMALKLQLSQDEMPICTVPMVTGGKAPMTKDRLQRIVTDMIFLKTQISSYEKISPSGAHWKASSAMSSHLGKITFDEAGNPHYCGKAIKMESGLTFLTSKVVELIDIKDGNLRLKNEDVVQASSGRVELNPLFVFREKDDHYEAAQESLLSEVVKYGGQTSGSACAVL